MTLRPATPLSVLLLAAFVLLLLSVLSVPVTKLVPLGSFRDVKFGVFGFCEANGDCSLIGLGYDTGKMLDNDKQAFQLPVNVRDTVSALLVVHPVAAFLALVMFVMAAVSHLHAPGHSAKYLLILFILIFVSFLVSLFAFIVDILLFIPHMDWGSYMVLVATIILGLSAIASCAIRRGIVSRKAHKRRIAQHPQMSGQDLFHTSQDQSKPALSVSTEPTLPMTRGANTSANDSLPQFPSLKQRTGNDRVSDESILLGQLSPLDRQLNSALNDGASEEIASFASTRQPSPRDQYGFATDFPNGIHGASTEEGDDMRPVGVHRGPIGGDYLGFQDPGPWIRGGEGGYGSPGRGGAHGRRPRYGPPSPGGYGTGSPRGGPQTYNYAAGPSDQRSSPDRSYYGRQQPGNSPGGPNFRSRAEAYAPADQLARAESLPSLATKPPTDVRWKYGAQKGDQYGQTQHARGDATGLVDPAPGQFLGRHDTMMTEESRYRDEEVYAPPRAAWNPGLGRNSTQTASTGIQYRHVGRETSSANSPQVEYYDDVYSLYAGPGPSENQYPAPVASPRHEEAGVSLVRTRSPSESEGSHLTSISQRGINPRWRPNGPSVPLQYGAVPSRRLVAQQRQQQRRDFLLDNPDFSLPSGRTQVRRGPGMISGSAYPGPPL